jgi:3-carboxy-cis,cis-muconate cycloisomerase
MLHDLQLYPARMRENLELTRGLIFAEAVSMTLAKSLGKMAAHQLVESACKAAVTEKRHLKDVLANDPVTSTKLTAAEIENLFDPQKYVGSAGIFIDNVIANARRITSA